MRITKLLLWLLLLLLLLLLAWLLLVIGVRVLRALRASVHQHGYASVARICISNKEKETSQLNVFNTWRMWIIINSLIGRNSYK